MDVDKWDYYSRDCHYLGVTTDFQQKLVSYHIIMIMPQLNSHNYRRCMLLGRIVEDSGEYHIAFRDKVCF